jgi:hypothetical protein
MQYFSCDVARLLASEEKDCLRYLFRFTQSFQDAAALESFH